MGLIRNCATVLMASATVVLSLEQTWAQEHQDTFDGQLYDAVFSGVLTDVDGDPDNFHDGDLLDLTITSASRGEALNLTFSGTRPAFDQWVDANLDAIMEILFPSSASEGVTGKEPSVDYAQRHFVDRVLEQKLRRSEIGGFIDVEFLTVDHGGGRSDTGKSLSGVLYINPLQLSLEGQYATVGDAKSYALGVDFHPMVRLQAEPAEWFAGASVWVSGRWIEQALPDASFDTYGDYDLGGSLSTSVRKDTERLRLVGGLAFQVSKTYVPTRFAPNDVADIVDFLNERPVDYQILSGGAIGLPIGARSSLNIKAVQTFARDSYTTLIAGISYLFVGVTPVDVGYKGTFGLEGITSNSIFVLGNYRF